MNFRDITLASFKQMQNFLSLILLFLFFASEALAQASKPSSITELATYAGTDREQLLYAGAKSKARSRGTRRSPAIPTKP